MQPESTEVRAFSKAVSGDRDAFAVLVRRHQGMVYSLARNFLHEDAAAEELAQEVFLELHRVLRTLESPDHVTNWLRRVTTHRCIDQARRDRHRPRIALDDIAEPAAPAQDGDILLTERLRKITASLPERARAVLLLRYQEDLEPGEIAQVLDMPLNTVKSQLQRSLAMLRGKLARTKVERSRVTS